VGFSKDGTMSMKQTVLVVHTSAIENTPPLRNCTTHFARRGIRVLVIGYKKPKLPKFERLGHGQWILRMNLKTRKIPGTYFRQACMLIEFLVAVRAILKRTVPRELVAFDDPASLCLVFASSKFTTRIAWLLEFSHPRGKSVLQKALLAVTSRFWRLADALVVPTRERLALHLCLRPECLVKKHFVIHNAPNCCKRSSPTFLESRNEHPLLQASEGRLRIVYSGGVGFGYGLENLIKAVGSMPDDFELLIIGPKYKRNETKSGFMDAQEAISKCIEDANDRGNILWLDRVPYNELQGILLQRDIGYVTYEPLWLNNYFSAPGKVYEYLKAGLVVLMDNASCLSRELALNDCGEFFPINPSEEDIRAALHRLVSKRDDIQKMKEKALKLFEQELCLDKQMEPLLTWLNEMGQCSQRM